MSKCALVKNGVVTNVITVDADLAIVVSDTVTVNSGDLYDENLKVFIKDPVLAEADRIAAEQSQ